MKKQSWLPIILFLISQTVNPSVASKDYRSFEYRVMNSLKQPVFKGDFSKVQEVLVNEYDITSATSSKPVLATCGLGPCVSLAGYNETYKIAFLTHYKVGSNVSWSYNNLVKELLALTNEKAKFELTLVGGEKNYSEGLIDIIKSRIDSESRLEMSLIQEDTLEFKSLVPWGTTNRSLVIDSRTGKIYSYDIFLNPYKINLFEIKENILSNFLPDKLIYEP